MTTKRKYQYGAKRPAIEVMLVGRRKVPEVARELGVSQQLVYAVQKRMAPPEPVHVVPKPVAVIPAPPETPPDPYAKLTPFERAKARLKAAGRYREIRQGGFLVGLLDGVSAMPAVVIRAAEGL